MAEKHPDVGHGKEFPTVAHRESHVAALEREVAGRKARFAELKALDDREGTVGRRILEQAQSEVDAAIAELKRLTGRAGAEKRPARARETR